MTLNKITAGGRPLWRDADGNLFADQAGTTPATQDDGTTAPATPKKGKRPEDHLQPDDVAIVHEVNAAPAEGLGDTVAAIAHRVGADRLAALFTRVTGIGCGCGWRKKLLNRLVPYAKQTDQPR